MPSLLELVWVSVNTLEHDCPQDISFRTELEQLLRPLDEEFKNDVTSSGPIFELLRLSASAGPWRAHWPVGQDSRVLISPLPL